MGRLFGARRTSPTLLQQLHVITCLGLIGSLLHLGVQITVPLIVRLLIPLVYYVIRKWRSCRGASGEW